MTISDFLTLGSICIALIIVIITLQQNRRQTKMFYEQLRLNFFADYTKRYQEIILKLPLEIQDKDFDINKIPSQEKNDVLRYIRVYFDLCSEEYFLYHSGKLDEKVWIEWKVRDNIYIKEESLS